MIAVWVELFHLSKNGFQFWWSIADVLGYSTLTRFLQVNGTKTISGLMVSNYLPPVGQLRMNSHQPEYSSFSSCFYGRSPENNICRLRVGRGHFLGRDICPNFSHIASSKIKTALHQVGQIYDKHVRAAFRLSMHYCIHCDKDIICALPSSSEGFLHVWLENISSSVHIEGI